MALTTSFIVATHVLPDTLTGFPSKRPYDEFVDHFWQLAPDLLKMDVDDNEVTKAILVKAAVTGYQLGLTKVRGENDGDDDSLPHNDSL